MKLLPNAILVIFLSQTFAWIPSESSAQQKPTRGFVKSTTDADERSSSAARKIYSRPALYDLAFGYRPFEDEVDFLLERHRDLTGRKPRSVLELAAGPARHALLARDQGVERVDCVDLSPEMQKYAMEIAEESEVSEGFTYHPADMRSFDIAGPMFDSAWVLLGSLQHMTTNQDVIECLMCLNKHLMPQGTVILELPHPSEIFAMVDCTRNGWEVPLVDENGEESGKLKVVWGDDDDEFDPIAQVRQFSVAMELEGAEEPQSIRETVPLRLFTTQEVDALARCAGFSVKRMYGALDADVSVDDEEEAFRMVCVLQKQ